MTVNTEKKKKNRIPIILGVKEVNRKVGDATKKVKVKMISAMPVETAAALGISEKSKNVSALTPNSKPLDGSRGAGSYKLWFGEYTPKGSKKLHALPVPSFAKVYDVMKFLNSKVVKKKPQLVITKEGKARPLLATKKK